jgi:cyclopropane-fatty-acyl-phospholipid synthase
MSVLGVLLRQVVRKGQLTLIEPSGASHVYGDGGTPRVVVHIHDQATVRRLFRDPHLALGEAYMDGSLTVEEGTLTDFLDLVTQGDTPVRHWILDTYKRLRRLAKPWHARNREGASKRNVAHHYDLSGALYDLFLDADRQYSCAYFRDGVDDLETAQRDKKIHLASKLLLKPGQRILDIGCGWGGLALHLARAGGGAVDGITLSEEQLAIARDRARRSGMADRLDFRLEDYRHTEGPYDRIVSVGMFEHVGTPNYDAYFGQIAKLLKDDGVAVLHSIGRMTVPGVTGAWIRKYIFPGGYVPALSEVLPAIERAGLWVTDVEILRLHYAETCAAWLERFMARRDEARALYDERFCRMWEFYLAGCICAFRNNRQMVFQIQMAKKVETVPLTRDYMFDAERTMLASAAPVQRQDAASAA